MKQIVYGIYRHGQEKSNGEMVAEDIKLAQKTGAMLLERCPDHSVILVSSTAQRAQRTMEAVRTGMGLENLGIQLESCLSENSPNGNLRQSIQLIQGIRDRVEDANPTIIVVLTHMGYASAIAETLGYKGGIPGKALANDPIMDGRMFDSRGNLNYAHGYLFGGQFA